jgi:hypothetical protein
MDTTLIVHAVTEVAVVGVITGYLITKINANTKEIEDLKAKLAEQEKQNQEFAYHINRLYSLLSNASPQQQQRQYQPSAQPHPSPPPPPKQTTFTPATQLSSSSSVSSSQEENLRKHSSLQQSINSQMGDMLDGFMNILPAMMPLMTGGQTKAEAIMEELNKKPTFEILEDDDDPDVAEAVSQLEKTGLNEPPIPSNAT